MKIYTKTGDNGTTSLASGRRLSKNELIIEAYGTVDELNSFIGLLTSSVDDDTLSNQLSIVQNLLFNIGSVLAKDGLKMEGYPSLNTKQIDGLEEWIDQWNKELSPLTNFILPGGSRAMSLAHVCRTICRRAERRIVALEGEIESSNDIVKYLNRLSDYFFIVARILSIKENIQEVIWDKNIDS